MIGHRRVSALGPPRSLDVRPLAAAGAVVPVVVGVAVLIGWYARIPVLTDLGTTLPPMRPITAVAFVLVGCAVGLLRFRRSECAGFVLAALVTTLGALLLLERASDPSLFLEEVLVPPGMPAPGPNQGLTSATASLHLLLCGLALLLLKGSNRARILIAQVLTALVGLSALIALAGWAYGVEYLSGLPGIDPRPGMALGSALLFLLEGVAIPALRPRHGWIAVLTSQRLGGFMARRMAVAAMLFPLVGFVVISGARRNLYPFESASAVMVVVALVLGFGVIIATASRLNRLDAERLDLLSRTAESKAWLEAVLQTSPAGVILFHPDGTLTSNAAANRLLGRPPDSKRSVAEYRAYFEYPDGTPVPLDQVVSARVQRGELIEGEEYRFSVQGQAPTHVMAWASPIRDESGAVRGGAALLFDITDRKELEERLRRTVAEREHLLRIVSHDLRNPLGVIVLSATQLLRQAPGGEDGSRKSAERIRAAAKQMQRLVEDLLEFGRAQAGQLVVNPQVAPCEALLEQTLSLFEEPAMERDVQLEFAPCAHLQVFADPDRVMQILSNLVGNALKFTPPGGSVRVEARALEDRVHFSVTDTGVGMAPEELQHVFEPFWQASRGDGRGIGMGLPIAHALVAAHGGELTVESAKGVGTTFRFTLPGAQVERAGSVEYAPHYE